LTKAYSSYARRFSECLNKINGRLLNVYDRHIFLKLFEIPANNTLINEQTGVNELFL
jgi:hypothetical protein